MSIWKQQHVDRWMSESRLRAAATIDLTGSRGRMERITGLAAHFSGAPYAQLSLLGRTQTVPVAHGIEVDPNATTPLEASICSLVIATGGPLVLGDTRLHPLVRELPPVRSGAVGAYAGVPIELDDEDVAVLCVYDSRSRKWDSDVLSMLHDASKLIGGDLGETIDRPAINERLDLGLSAFTSIGRMPRLSWCQIEAASRGPEGAAPHGDFFDADLAHDGALSFVLCDVAGHDLAVTDFMLGLRALARSGLAADLTPADLATTLDHFCSGRFHATALVGRLESTDVGGRLRFVSAGHPFPARRDRAPDAGRRPDPPLGTEWGQWNEHTLEVARGERAVLFTDGLIGRRPEGDVDEAIARWFLDDTSGAVDLLREADGFDDATVVTVRIDDTAG